MRFQVVPRYQRVPGNISRRVECIVVFDEASGVCAVEFHLLFRFVLIVLWRPSRVFHLSLSLTRLMCNCTAWPLTLPVPLGNCLFQQTCSSISLPETCSGSVWMSEWAGVPRSFWGLKSFSLARREDCAPTMERQSHWVFTPGTGKSACWSPKLHAN